MKLDFRNNKDFWAGIHFIGIGAGAMIIARNYPFGSIQRMGPGYFPIGLAGILILFGIYIMVRGLQSNQKILSGWSPRALIFLPVSMVMFGVLIEYAGFVPALMALVFIVSLAPGKTFNVVEVLLLSVVLTVLSVAMFIWGLGLPFLLINFR